MVYSYNELLKMKDAGIKLDFAEITKEQLENLFYKEGIRNSEIADLYNVTYDKVRKTRSKLGITAYTIKYQYETSKRNNSTLFNTLNKTAKENLMKEENIDWIAKSLTHYLFRNGPVEDMHADKKLSQNDMKVLNKYMVNRIAGLLKLIEEGEWLKIGLMLETLSCYGREWDKAEYDTKEIETIFNYELDDIREKQNN